MGVIVTPLGAFVCGACKHGWHETLSGALRCAELHGRPLAVGKERR